MITSGTWETMKEIADRTGYPPEIVVARIRDEHLGRQCECRFMPPDRTEWKTREVLS